MFEVGSSPRKVVIGVLTPHTGGFYYGTVVNGILEVARRHGAIAIAFETSRLRLAQHGGVLAGARVDGWLAINEFNDPELLAALRARGAPIVHVHSRPDIDDGAVVLPDNEGGTRALTEHLLAHGHRRIAFAGNLTHIDMAERLFGFAAALDAAGVPIDDKLVFDTPHHKEIDGQNVAKTLLAMPAGSVTALVGATDRVALGAQQAFLEAGRRVPEDFAIVGFDDADAAQFAEPPLTTVRQSFADIAACAFTELMAAILDRRTPTGLIRVSTQVVLRRSCGCLESHSQVPRPVAAGEGRVQSLTSELLALAGTGQMSVVTLEQWPEAEKVAQAIEAGATGTRTSEVVRGDWWSGFLRYQRDAESAVRVLSLLEHRFSAWAGEADSPAIRGVLRDLRVALMHQWQRTERLKVAHFESVTETAYRLARDLSGSGADPAEDLGWIRWSNAYHACCALWEEPQASAAAPSLVITGEYRSVTAPGSVAHSWVSQEEFPPLALLETADREGSILCVASVPSGRSGEYGLLAVVAPLAFEHLEYVGTPGNWAVQLGAALDRARSEKELRRSAELDALTGLPNRATLLKRMDAARAAGQNTGFAVLLVDVDDFKKINDSLGHDAGDRLLVQIADRLVEEVASTSDLDRASANLVARVGGDEFAIMLQGIDGEAAVVAQVQRLKERLEQPYLLQGRTVFVSASIGVNLGQGAEAGTRDLLRDADTAMYHAKTRGRARHEIFHKGMHAQAVEKLHLDARLRQALEQDELELWYQPIVDLPGMVDVGAEALIRWRHPEQGLLPPGRFLPVAEEVGLAIPISEWVIRRACAEAARFQATASQPLYVNVNVPAVHIKQPDFVDFVERALAANGLSPRVLGIEIVESTLLDERAKATLALSKLLALGVRVAVDDFGTGYSSLSYLRDFPVSTLKIDRSFVRNLPDNSRDGGIARAIIAMGQGMGLGIVAEGIENYEQLQFLAQAGCDYGQGYFIAMPLERSKYMERLTNHRARPSGPTRWSEALARSTPPREGSASRSAPPSARAIPRDS